MKPEYKLTAKDVDSKNKIVEGLIAEQYIVSVKKLYVGCYEICVYGKEQSLGGFVGGSGHVTSTSISGGHIHAHSTTTASITTPKKQDTFWMDNSSAPKRSNHPVGDVVPGNIKSYPVKPTPPPFETL